MSLFDLKIERQSHPVDMIEFVADSNDWAFERPADDEIAMTVEGKWADYTVSFSWMEKFEAIHFSCAFDLKVPDSRVNEVIRLLSHVNGELLMGHFDVWQNADVIVFRQSLPLSGGVEPTGRQVEMMLSNGLETCEAYYQAFQFVVWSGMDAQSAVSAVMFETVGQA
ncbi:YbjN domain-containing protein [Rhizobium sp. KVB221]|uniref:YbjN domain-containing protein n=1 Tax=Rhizobium setariae TaxID=2801340 RepID=A0A937CKB0_9HYPH|nr:YbjN domain-containing protein [Rhizobium setariae]MBL0371960.1 YbjN domain-containing protein [Rhizobium setariae]